MIRVHAFGVRSRPAAIALAALALALGGVFVVFGIVLLLGLAAVGTLAGVGLLLFRTLTGRGARRIQWPDAQADLDPSLQVFPRQSASRPLPQSLTRPPPDKLE